MSNTASPAITRIYGPHAIAKRFAQLPGVVIQMPRYVPHHVTRRLEQDMRKAAREAALLQRLRPFSALMAEVHGEAGLRFAGQGR